MAVFRRVAKKEIAEGIRRLPFLALAAILAAGCMARPGSPPSPSGFEQPAPPGAEMDVAVRVDTVRSLVVMEAGPFRIPEAESGEGHHGGHAHQGANTPLLLFDWPVDGWYRGFRVEVVDQDGVLLPDELMHHLIGVNFSRRQVVYPVPERFVGIGTETRDLMFPEKFGIPVERGARLGVYASWRNETGRPIETAYIRVALVYTPRGSDVRPERVVPIYMDTNNRIGSTNAFDLPPGRTERGYEFTLPVAGALLGLSGHLHDYGRHVRLEDAETGEVLVKLEGIRDEAGRVEAVEQKIFRRFFGLLDARIRLEADHRYRVVGVYDNPTSETIERGAMAHLSGIFAPARMGSWASLDTSSEHYLKDVAALPEPFPHDLAPVGVGRPMQESTSGDGAGKPFAEPDAHGSACEVSPLHGAGAPSPVTPGTRRDARRFW